MRDPFFFGYGSLVNRQTHTYPNARRAKVTGWQRAWRRASQRGWCYLTAIAAPNAELWGLAAVVPGADWQALDRREAAYERHLTEAHLDEDSRPVGQDQPQISIYAIAPDKQHQPDDSSPVLLSYLDVVVQGYLREFGEEGVTHFFNTTHGWDAPILDDRHAPNYPRHQALDHQERALVDEELERLAARIIRQS